MVPHPHEAALRRILREYVELPALSLTPGQVKRLLAQDDHRCQRVLASLEEAGCVIRRPMDGRYVRPPEVDLGVWRQAVHDVLRGALVTVLQPATPMREVPQAAWQRARRLRLRVQDIMTTGVRTIGPDEQVGTAWREMRRHRIHHLAVVEHGDIVGVLSERDLGRRESERVSSRLVREVMTKAPVSAPPSTTLRQAARLMQGHAIGSLLVVEDGTLRGVVTTTDLLTLVERGAAPPTARPRSRALPQASGPGASRRKPVAHRVPLPVSVPRPVKATRTRTSEIPPPAHIRVIGAELRPAEKDAIGRKLGMKLAKFAASIERLTVRALDANGPKGGVDQICRIKIVLSGLPSLMVERQHAALPKAIDAAIRAAVLAVRSRVQRRRLKPLHRRRPVAAGRIRSSPA
ncbi:MAG: CBS domain-containing protein [Dehalococcoidia bacterium]